jgi:hypothetical protein
MVGRQRLGPVAVGTVCRHGLFVVLVQLVPFGFVKFVPAFRLHGTSLGKLGESQAFHDCKGYGVILDPRPFGFVKPEVVACLHCMQMVRNHV